MDVLSPLLHLALRSIVVLFPLCVGLLAFRRLALSHSINAWVYAIICLYSAIAAAGILPWGLGMTELQMPLLLLALSCPLLWVGTLLVFDLLQMSRHGSDPLLTAARNLAEQAAPNLTPLVLGEAQRDMSELPMFRHRIKPKSEEDPPAKHSDNTYNLLRLARDMRGNASSEWRRPKLLPPPEDGELPFLQRRRSA